MPLVSYARKRFKRRKPPMGLRVDHPRDDAVRFILRLARALHMSGTPTYRLEDTMRQVSKNFGVPCEFFCTPTAIIIAFENGSHEYVHLLRLQPADDNLGLLCDVDEVTQEVMDGGMTADQGAHALDEISARSKRYGMPLTVFGFTLVSAAAARFFGGGLWEICAAALAGLSTGLLYWLATRWDGLARTFPILAAFLITFAMHLFSNQVQPILVYTAVVSGVIVLLPGMTITVAMAELATQNLVSGTARLMGAITLLIQLGFGLALADQLALRMFPIQELVSPIFPLDSWTEWAALAVGPFAFVILFQTRRKDVLWAMLASWAAFLSSRYAAISLGPILGAFSGALLIGILANVYSRGFNRPSAVITVPGIIMLVPGSIGFRSVNQMLHDDILSGLEAAFSVTLVAVALVSGLLIASLLAPPRKTL